MTKKTINLMCLINRIVFSGLFSTKLTNGLSFVMVSILFNFISNTSNALDAPLPWQMNFQQPASPTMEGIIDLHHNIMIFMIYIVIFISYILIRAIMLFNFNKKSPYSTISRTRHHLSLEVIWTILPLLILFWIALPSFALLYSIDHCPKVDLTIKVIGRQWYWTYEIDAFVKHKVRKPTYMDLKETSLFYEIMAELAKKLVEAGIGDVRKVSCLTSETTSADNIYIAALYRIITNNFKITQAEVEQFANTYLSLITSSRDQGVVQDINVADSKIKSKDHFIIKNSTINFDLKEVEHWKLWKPFSAYDDVPRVFQEIPEGAEKPILICPAFTHPDMAFTGTPNTLISYPHGWKLETIIENFEDVYSEKHHTGFKLFTKIDFFKLLSYFVYKQHLENKTRGHAPLDYLAAIESVICENEADAAAWYCINNYFNPKVCLNHVVAMENADMVENKKYIIPILAEYYYFNADDCIYETAFILLEWKNRFNFKNSELLKPFFTALLTGEVYDFLKALDKKGLTLTQFLESFQTWYDRLYPSAKHISMEFSKNPDFYSPMLKVLAGGDFDWVKENGVSFTRKPSVFGEKYEQYYQWASGILTEEGTLNMDIMLEKIEKSRFTRFGIVDINVEFKHVFEDAALIKKNEKLAESLMTSPLTLKTYVFFHSLWEKEIFDKQASSKNKFDHYLVEFDSCIVSDNEVYNNYLNISKNEDSLNLENLPTSFCGWWRLLEVDNRLVLPIKTRLRILVTSSDVLHSWAVPSLGVKIDACPGRLNCVYVYIKRPGVFHGQCSELCGVKHGFMPIVVHAVTRDKYNRWFADTCEFIN